MEKLILEVPKWRGKIYFDYPTLHVCLVIAFLLVGVALCFWGWRYMKTFCLALVGCIVGKMIIQVSESTVQSDILRMFLFVVSIYFSVAVALAAFNLMNVIAKKTAFGNWFRQKQYLIAALFGACIIGGDCYAWIYRNAVICILLIVIFAVSGSLLGKKKTENSKVFYTYEDIYERTVIHTKEATDA